ncbi:hypothetical protein ASZ90_010673 [hydrocarbon metagenome]|uniref:Uncharacterized protein n=1 Tax=hydrocarbon metagenome TaxID=938273 RepID=A0A0W8FG24_9ZZZZ
MSSGRGGHAFFRPSFFRPVAGNAAGMLLPAPELRRLRRAIIPNRL